MSNLDRYLVAAERENTRRSYDSAVRHFEVEWKGLLPATASTLAEYLSHFASTLSINTLRQRLAALSRWHTDNGFQDPTKSPLIRQVFKGIRTLHPTTEKRARPLEVEALHQMDEWLVSSIGHAESSGDRLALMQHTRNRSLVLLGFWRGFRADELARLRVKDVQITPGEGMTCHLSRSKGDRQLAGRTYPCPALSRLCPVTAYEAWIRLSGISDGAVYRKIDRWGKLADDGLHPNSLITLLRKILQSAGIAAADEYSSHSLRRGFAGWARSSGWDLKDLMEYVGWKDIKSAMRYLEGGTASLQERFERGLESLTPVNSSLTSPQSTTQENPVSRATVQVTVALDRFTPQSRGLTRARRLIEEICFARYAMQNLDARGTRYELTVPCPSREELDESIYAMLDEMYRIANDNQCSLEVSLHEPATDTYWD